MLIILGERHLVQVLREYFDHYHRPGRIAPSTFVLQSPNRSRMAARSCAGNGLTVS